MAQVIVSGHELWLVRRAACGDQGAFEVLLERNRGRLIALAREFTDDTVTFEECFSIVLERVWRELRRGKWDPYRASFGTFIWMAAHEALKENWRYRHARMRWPEEPPASLDVLDGMEQPSWSYGADPLAVVVWRETWEEAVRKLTAAQLAAVNAYAATGGVGVGPRTASNMYAARQRVRPLLVA
jgi:DNA-directed RNA polymerase specialized sigma24 family protein